MSDDERGFVVYATSCLHPDAEPAWVARVTDGPRFGSGKIDRRRGRGVLLQESHTP